MQHPKRNLGIILVILGLFFLQKTQAQSVNDPRLAGIEGTINKILADHHAAGVAVAVVEKNKVVYARGFGYRDIEKQTGRALKSAPPRFFLSTTAAGCGWARRARRGEPE